MSHSPNPQALDDFLQQEVLGKVVDEMLVVPMSFGVIDQFIPNRDQDPRLPPTIRWEERISDGLEYGMTPLVDVRADNPYFTGGGARRKSWTPPHYREGYRWGAADYLGHRELGTYGEPLDVISHITRMLGILKRRVEMRRLYLKWMAVQATAAFTVRGVGADHSIDYSGIGYHPTVGTLWSAPGADIIGDIIDFQTTFRDAEVQPRGSYFGSDVYARMLSNQTLSLLIREQIARKINPNSIYEVFSADGLIEFLGGFFGGMQFNYYREGPTLSLKTISRSMAGTTAFVEGPLSQFAVGDTCTLVRPSADNIDLTLTAVSMANGSVSDNVNLAGVDIPMGSIIRKKVEFVDDDKFVMFGALPAGQLGGQDIAEFVTVVNPHTQDFMKPESGIVTRAIDQTNDSIAWKAVIMSMTGGIVAYHREGWLSATVL